MRLKANAGALYRGLARIAPRAAGVNCRQTALVPEAEIVYRATLDEFLALSPADPEAGNGRLTRFSELLAQSPSRTDWSRGKDYVGPGPVGAWNADPFRLEIRDRIRQSMKRDAYTGGIEMIEPRPAHYAMTAEADRLLCGLIPELWESTGPAVLVTALIDGGFQSSYVNETPLLINVNTSRLADALMAAETVFHECLHQKFVDMRLTTHLLREGYNDRTSVPVMIPWGRGKPRRFSTARGMATHHVYVHLAVLLAIAVANTDRHEALRRLGSDTIERRLRRCFDRASFLSEELVRDGPRTEMGSDGLRFVEWINSALKSLRDIPLPSGDNLVATPFRV